MMKIPLRNRKKDIVAYALVDDEDYDYLNKWRWHRDRNGYASRNKVEGGRWRRIFLHRLIANTPKGMDTDHINGNVLDNRKKNLRACTHAENMWNTCKHRDNTSGYKGVCWHKSTSKWQACVRIGEKRIYLGLFKDPIFAASAYNEAAKKNHGEFARLNTFQDYEDAQLV